MGTEIAFVLIYPVALISAAAALWFWFALVRAEQSTAMGYMKGFAPLIAGFAVSAAGLTLLTYVDGDAYFTWLIQNGYYTEAQRPIYLPSRIVGQAIVDLVFALPAISFLVIPLTRRLITTNRLKLSGIALRAVIAWITLSLIGWLLNLGTIVPPWPLSDFLKSTIVPVLIYGLPVPIAALFFYPHKRMA